MTRKIVAESPATRNRKQQSLGEKKRPRIGEVAGGATAECAAVCCCCPCSLMNLLILVAYKVPAGLWRKAWKKKKKRKRLLKNKQQQENRKSGGSGDESDGTGGTNGDICDDGETAAVDWDKFYGTGFWRNPSQKEDFDT